jgi:hypothetical protein
MSHVQGEGAAHSIFISTRRRYDNGGFLREKPKLKI